MDTAQGYGSAEAVLGNCWPTDSPRRLISKLSARVPPDRWEGSLMSSLQRLHASSLDGFLVHCASDLRGSKGAELLYWLESLRDRGLVNRIGVSIYNASELEGLPLDHLQLVQLPLSVYDQRLIRNSTIARLQDSGIAVHVRSVFLQGLLLQPPQFWADHLSPEFIDHHVRWFGYLHQHGLSPLAGALGFVRACEGVEAVLVGVQSCWELSQVCQTWKEAAAISPGMEMDWAWENVMDLDPRHWP